MEEPKRSMSREELYELVWSTPMQKLAETFGLSDRGLAKTCQRYLVPVPSRGYWAKIDAGQPVKRTPLRAVENTALHTVHIGGRQLSAPSPYLLEVMATAKREVEAENQLLSRSAGDESRLPFLTMPAPAPETGVEANRPSKLTSGKLQPDVQAFISELRRCQVDRDGFIQLKWIKIAPKDVNRVGAILDSLARQLKRYEFIFDGGGSRLGFSRAGTTVDFEIEAPRKRETNVSRTEWRSFTYKHVGRFKLRIFGRADGVKKEWIDRDSGSIEDHLDKIVESFRLNHVAEREYEERSRQEAARRAHMASRRKMAEQRTKRESDRLAFLQSIADARREADDLRETISTIPYCEDLPADYRRMLEWAQKRLMQLEEQTRVEAIQTSLEAKLLFADPDPLYDPEGDPPVKVNYWDD
ncbi:hypothetical protein [Agrobacterium pusense]|uniref:hypothetical protein n=1 Tax=Agrobacterium pusense TaxID=648995 RepID=UPI0028B01B40|nr:hypothetical protein [Agrobacterium pusense]